MKQTFVERQSIPIRPLSLHTATNGGVEHDNGLGEVLDEINIHHFLPLLGTMTRYSMDCHLVNRGKAYLKQSLPVDVHKITPDIHLHHITGHGVVLAFFPNVFFEPPDAVMRTTSLDTTVAVVNESALIDLMRVIVIEMMHDAVAEVGGKHLSLLGVGDDEATGGFGFIRPVEKLITQLNKILSQISFKSLLVWFVALMAAGIIISLTQVGKKPFPRQGENGCFRQVLPRRTHWSDRLAVVAVVVVHVDVARIEVEVPCVVRVADVERTRPVVAVAACVVEAAIVTVAGSGQEEYSSMIASAVLLFSGPKECLKCKPTASSALCRMAILRADRL